MGRGRQYNIVGYGSPEGSPRSISSILLSFGKSDTIKKVPVSVAQSMAAKGQINLSNTNKGER